MTGPADLFTLSSFATLQGGALAAIIVPNSIGYFGIKNKAVLNGISFVTSEIAAYAIAYVSDSGDRWKWVIAALNGFVIFSAAMGQGQASHKLVGGPSPVAPAGGVGMRHLFAGRQLRVEGEPHLFAGGPFRVEGEPDLFAGRPVDPAVGAGKPSRSQRFFRSWL